MASKMSSNGNNFFTGAPVSAPMHDASTFESLNISHMAESSGQCEIENSDSGFKEPPTKLAVLGMWRSEVFALLVSLSAFAATLGILGAFNEKLQPKLPTGINITTLISVCSTVMRAAMVFVLAEVIGQSKWFWMAKPRPLRHIDHFDQAGRGTWGSVKFLLRTWKIKLHVVSLSAFIIVVSHGIVPFSQQAVKTYACSTKIPGIATVAYAKWISWTDAGAEAARLVPELQAVALKGLLFGADFDTLSSLFQCTSGNCTCDLRPDMRTIHATVGFCSKCTDVTADLRQTDCNRTSYNFGGMQEFNVTWPPTAGNIFNIRSSMDSENPTSARTSILAIKAAGCPNGNTSHVGADGRTCQQKAFSKGYRGEYGRIGSDVDIVAINCTLSPCVQRYNAVVTSGILQESLVSEDPIDNMVVESDGNFTKFWRWNTMIEPCLVNGTWYDRSNMSKATYDASWVVWKNMDSNGTLSKTPHTTPRECVRTIGYPMVAAMQEYLAATLSGNCTYHSSFVPDTGRGGFMRDWDTKEQIQISCKYKWWLEYLYREGRMTLESIAAAHQGMATAVSNRVRANMNLFDGETSTIKGSVWTTAVCVRADWPWLAFPGGLLVLTTFLLVEAYVQSCRHRAKLPVWKSTILPLLFYNVSVKQDRPGARETGYKRTTLPQLKELEELANKTNGHFNSDPDRPGFEVDFGDANRKQQRLRYL
ncbi:hypothetical protein CMUS01_15445 [Colletotrichum musicola]|uniref:Uncharacterized protein n=1 Tax=Colletotrichum musicola TaxID=2175873 RepID=A0A8H6IWK9_9PEZI|nr:hypothetical protein CMUS01_15445 [Colletotrichum musicola]